MDQFLFNIQNINLLDKSDPVDYSRRLTNIATKLNSDKQRAWQLIGLCECYAERKGTYPVFVEKSIPCATTGCSSLAVECFAATLRGGSATDPLVQEGEVGIIARTEIFERADDRVMKKLLGYKWFNTVRRQVIGIRLRLKATGHVLPFFSTHITHFEDEWYTRDQARVQLEDLTSAIRHWWKRGDLVPIVVGDFNSHSWNHDDWYVMERDFELIEDARAQPPADGIEHIWLGRRDRFRGSSGSFVVDGGEFLSDYYDDGKDLSDHGVPFVTLTGPSSRFLGNIHKKEVHDLDKITNYCQVNEILQASHGRDFETIYEAKRNGYDNCAYCIGGSTR